MSKASVPPTKDVLLKSYQKRLKDDINSIISNFNEIIKLCRVEEENQVSRSTQCEEDAFEMQVRAANMVRASESLMKLISDIKQYLILNDFPSVNQAIAENSRGFLELQNKCDLKLTALRDDIAAELYDLEEEYYQSLTKYGDREKEKSETR